MIQNYTNFTPYIHTYHSRYIPEGVAEVSQIFLRDSSTFQRVLEEFGDKSVVKVILA
jgi:hypothetical protein